MAAQCDRPTGRIRHPRAPGEERAHAGRHRVDIDADHQGELLDPQDLIDQRGGARGEEQQRGKDEAGTGDRNAPGVGVPGGQGARSSGAGGQGRGRRRACRSLKIGRPHSRRCLLQTALLKGLVDLLVDPPAYRVDAEAGRTLAGRIVDEGLEESRRPHHPFPDKVDVLGTPLVVSAARYVRVLVGVHSQVVHLRNRSGVKGFAQTSS